MRTKQRLFGVLAVLCLIGAARPLCAHGAYFSANVTTLGQVNGSVVLARQIPSAAC